MTNHSALARSTAFDWIEAQLGARAFSRRSNPARMMQSAIVAADVGVVLCMSMVAHFVRYGVAAVQAELMLVTLLAAVLLGNVLRAAGGYTLARAAKPTPDIGRALQGWCLVFTSLLVLAYLTKTSEQFSRVWMATWFVGTGVGLVAVRIWAFRRLMRWRRAGTLARTVAIVDLDGSGVRLARSLQAGSAGEMHLLGVFVTQSDATRQNRMEDLLGLAKVFRVDEIIISADGEDHRGIEAAMLRLGAIPANIRLGLPMPTLSVPARDASMVFGRPCLTLSTHPLGDWAKLAKRLEDLVIGSVALVLFAPLMGLCALAIKLDSPGPVLFRQKRLGFNNNVISVFKLRTMTQAASAAGDVTQAQRTDARVTRVGKWLRCTSLDELPQLFNVVRGDMSLVGPRPHALAHNEHYSALIDGYLRRHNVQPGMTGLAQVNGCRGLTDTVEKMRRRVEYDLAYTDRWSLALDLKIMAQTVTTLFDKDVF